MRWIISRTEARAAIAAALLISAPLGALAQSVPPPVTATPSGGTTAGGNASGTIGTGGTTFQQVFAPASTAGAPSAVRHGCTIQNNGTHTMWVEEGVTTASATQAASAQLPGGGSGVYYCSIPGSPTVLQGRISITGTAGDAFYAAQW